MIGADGGEETRTRMNRRECQALVTSTYLRRNVAISELAYIRRCSAGKLALNPDSELLTANTPTNATRFFATIC
jgi:hypothetical protein